MSVLRRAVKAIPGYGSPIVESITTPDHPRSDSLIRIGGVEAGSRRAMRLSAVSACIRLRAETLAATPIDVVQRREGGRVQVPGPSWLDRPNPECTRFDLIERTSASLDCDGNAFWYLIRDRLGRVVEVWPLPPAKVRVYRDKPSSPADIPPRRYEVDGDEIAARNMLHIQGFSLPGALRGMNPILQHAHAVGLAVAAEEFGAAFFERGAVMSGHIESPADPGAAAVERMRLSFSRNHGGVRNAHRPGFLYGGAKWVPSSVPNDAAQFLETRKFQVSEIARMFRVPPHKIGDLDRATFSNIEHQAIEWVTDGLVPYAARIESAVYAAGLIGRDEQLKFNFGGLLRGDLRSRYAAYAIGRQNGWLSVNDIRELEDQNPVEGGDVYLQPLNMVAAGADDEPVMPPTLDSTPEPSSVRS